MRGVESFPGVPVIKNPPCDARDTGSVQGPKSLMLELLKLVSPRAHALQQEKSLL